MHHFLFEIPFAWISQVLSAMRTASKKAGRKMRVQVAVMFWLQCG